MAIPHRSTVLVLLIQTLSPQNAINCNFDSLPILHIATRSYLFILIIGLHRR